MSPEEYISQQSKERQDVLTSIHKAIIANDKSVSPVIEPMMGKEMIIYKEECVMKYGLSSVKNYMSLHCLPIYMNPVLQERYQALLPKAKFQKGCVNFLNADEMPPGIIGSLAADCAKINIAALLRDRKKSKTSK